MPGATLSTKRRADTSTEPAVIVHSIADCILDVRRGGRIAESPRAPSSAASAGMSSISRP
jgi:hypothetical protein